MDGQLGFEVDASGSFVTVTGIGIWSPEYTEAHFREIEPTIQKIRHVHGRARVLVDLRDALVQTAQTAAIVRACTTRIYRADDRVAIVCATGLLALQMKRTADIERLATFHKIDAARRWIDAD